ncbi:MAG: putative lipid II flippase FtsW [Puniceicoccaceae bacterium]|nr:MAG: putative lipid II flippase FtsW [Puniceicoccaceae bacterium]
MARPTAISASAASGHGPVAVLMLAAAALTLLGLAIMFSASVTAHSNAQYFIHRQLIWVCVALAAMVVVWQVPLDWLRSLAWVLGGLALASLVLVLIPGIGLEINGSRRWLDLGPMRVQPSEFAKLALIFCLAHYCGLNQNAIGEFWKGFVLPCAGIGVVFVLLMLEPDYGTAVLTAGLGVLLLFLAGARLIYLVPSGVAGLGLFTIAVMANPVRQARILAFLDPETSRSDAGYQLYQAKLAFGVGGTTGVGLGNGSQQFAYLPEAHTDFIFAIVGEELGLVAALGVVILYATVLVAGVLHLRRAPTLFHYLLLAGCLLLLSLQSLINLGVVTGCLPTKGIALPFISYGGSNLVLMGMILGLVLNSHRTWSSPVLRERRRTLREVSV